MLRLGEKVTTDFIRTAVELIRQKDWQQAKSLLAEELSKKPLNWAPVETSELEQIVHCWDQEEFIAYCERAEKPASERVMWMTGSYSHAWYLVAYIAVEEGNLEDAFGALRNGLEMEPDHPRLWCELGHLLQQIKRHEDALRCYQRAEVVRAWASDSQKAQALRGQGINLIDLGQLEEAEKVLQRSLEFAPGNAGALHELGYIRHLREGVQPTP